MNFLDKVINYFDPAKGYQRAAFRRAGGMQASYRGANYTRSSTPWSQSESMGGLPSLNLWVHRSMRDRARSLVENNTLASSILERAVENVIGEGFTLQMQTEDSGWNKRAETLLNAYFPISDFHGRSWVEYQKLLCRCYMRDGDVGEMLLKKGQTAIVEGDYISSPYDRPTAFLHDGVELDEFGRKVQFWVMSYVDLKTRTWTGVKAKDFVFLANMKRAVQYRGETFYAQSFELFDRHEGIWESVAMAMEIAASIIVANLKSPNAKIAGLSAARGGTDTSFKETRVKKGMIQALELNENIQQMKNEQPGGDFSPNLKLLIREIGLSFGMPLEYCLMDWSAVSGNTAKAVMLGAQRSFQAIQKYLIDTSYTRKTRWRISKLIKEGLLEDRPDAFAHEWHAPPFPLLNRLDELKAMGMAIDLGVSTEDLENKRLGQQGAKLRVARAQELIEKRAKGIPILHTTLMQEIGVKAPASDQEDVGTPDPGGEAPNVAAPGESGDETSTAENDIDPSTDSGQGDNREAA